MPKSKYNNSINTDGYSALEGVFSQSSEKRFILNQPSPKPPVMQALARQYTNMKIFIQVANFLGIIISSLIIIFHLSLLFDNGSIGIIGGADGPTAVFVTRGVYAPIIGFAAFADILFFLNLIYIKSRTSKSKGIDSK